MKKNNLEPVIFATIFLVFGFISMWIMIWFYLPCIFLREPYKGRYHKFLSKIWMKVLITIVRCPIKYQGMFNFQQNKNYVIVANHASNFDPIITTPFFPNANKSIAKRSYSLIPVFGWIYAWGSILVDRKNRRSKLNSYFSMKKYLAKGLDIVLYPEGTRNKTTKLLLPFKDGAFKLSIETKTPIIPIVIFESSKILSPTKIYYLNPTKVYVKILEPISPENHTVESLKNVTFQIMEENLKKGF